MTELTMIVSLSTVVAVTMFCFNYMTFELVPSLIAGNVSAVFIGSALETGAFATPASMNILILGLLIAPVFALLFNTETPLESNPSRIVANTVLYANRAAPAEYGIVTPVSAEERLPARAA